MPRRSSCADFSPPTPAGARLLSVFDAVVDSPHVLRARPPPAPTGLGLGLGLASPRSATRRAHTSRVQSAETDAARRTASALEAERRLTAEMQSEMDDMLRAALGLMEERARLAMLAEEAERRLEAVQRIWRCGRRRASRSVAVQTGGDESDSAMRQVVAMAVADTLERVLGAEWRALRLSMDATHTAVTETVRSGAAERKRRAQSEDTVQTAWREALQRMDATDRETAAQLTAIRAVIKKTAQLSSHNGKVMDDKLNDILLCQSSMARQLTMREAPQHVRLDRRDATPCANGATETSDEGVARRVSLTRDVLGKGKTHPTHISFPNREEWPVAVSMPAHEWDVAESDDESIPPLPQGSMRKTPYDMHDV